MPVPPAHLRVKVITNADALSFLQSGQNHVKFIVELLERNGISVGDSILDFGCGCGRVLRWWKVYGNLIGRELQLHGSDINGDLIRWCAENLDGVDARVNDHVPPVAFEAESFDLIYTISIFTHLPAEQQRPWLEELMRVLKPGGHLMLTVAGTAYEGSLSDEDRRSYDAGRLVTYFEETPGSNLCAAFHPRSYVEEELVTGFELVDVFPGDPDENMRQDVYLVRKPAG